MSLPISKEVLPCRDWGGGIPLFVQLEDKKTKVSSLATTPTYGERIHPKFEFSAAMLELSRLLGGVWLTSSKYKKG